MLELAHKLADSDAKFFGGWVLAGAEAHIHQPAEAMANQVLLAKERKSISAWRELQQTAVWLRSCGYFWYCLSIN